MTIGTLFLIGFWVAVGSAVFSIGLYIVVILLSLAVAGIGWVIEKIKGA